MGLLDNFPSHLQARDDQKEILNAIEQRLKSGYSKIILSAPTGIGKSAIAMTLATSYEKSFVITSSKNLQDQYVDDFDALVPVKGKSNFPCFKAMEQKSIDLQEYDVALRQGLSCNKGECEERSKEGKRQNCKFKPLIQAFQDKRFDETICPYYEQKYSALLADHSVWNYSSYFQTIKYNRGTYEEYLNRNISIFDEAHSIEDQILHFVGIEILKTHIDECEIRIESYDLSDITMIVELLRDIAEFYARKTKEIQESRAYQENPNYNLINKLDNNRTKFARAISEISVDLNNFIINEPNYEKGKFKSITLKPLDVSKYVKEFFITPFQIFMSATINEESFSQNIGFSSDKIAFVDTPHSPFHLENRKVEFLNTARLSYNSPQVNENRVFFQIDELLSKHKNQRGLILTSSRVRCENIVKNLSPKNKNRIRICHARNPNGKTQDNVVKEHANSKDGVLISSSLWQGVDLKDDLSRFQIIAKAPFPNPTEKWVESKMDIYPFWYTSQTISKILQGLGRSVRSKQDYAITYILDSMIEPLLNNSKNLVPKSYYDVFGWAVQSD